MAIKDVVRHGYSNTIAFLMRRGYSASVGAEGQQITGMMTTQPTLAAIVAQPDLAVVTTQPVLSMKATST